MAILKANYSELGAMINRLQLRQHSVALWAWLIGHSFVLFLLIPLALFSLLVFFATTQHLRIEARTGSVEIDFSSGHPIAWAMDGAQLLDCSRLTQVATRVEKSYAKEQQARLADGAEIELAPIKEADSTRLNTIRARLSLDGNDLLVELKSLTKTKGDATVITPDCAKDGSGAVVLDTGDGKRRAIRLPAQLRLDGEGIGDGLTLEFRGDLRIGNDITSGRQPLLTSGRLTLREVRWRFVQWLGDAQFDIESRDLGLGDKVTLAERSHGEDGEDAPQGFVRIVKDEKNKPTEMSVYATTVAGRTQIVHPFSSPESPKANLFRRIWADVLLTATVGFIVTLTSLYFAFLAIKTEPPNRDSGG